MLLQINLKNTCLVEISAHEASKYNQRWHSKLPKIHPSNINRNRHKICFGLFYKNNCIAVGLWSSPISRNFNPDIVLELRRLAIGDNAPKNTASFMISKMIKYIKKKIPTIEMLISYQDTVAHYGTIYKASNWIIDGSTKFTSWNISRNRNKDQTTANKIRWAYYLNNIITKGYTLNRRTNSISKNGLNIRSRTNLINHSLTGFNWGYCGSGCSQASLAIISDFLDNEDIAYMLYQDFKEEVISKLHVSESHFISDESIENWISHK